MEGLHTGESIDKLPQGSPGTELELEDDDDGLGGLHATTDLYVEDAWVWGTLGGLLEEESTASGDIGRFAQALDVAEDLGLRVVRAVRVVTTITTSGNKPESSLRVFVAGKSRGFANADGTEGYYGASAGIGATGGPDVYSLVRVIVIDNRDIHTKLNLPLPTILVDVDEPAEGPMVFDSTLVGSLLVRETGANLSASIDDVDKKNATLDDLLLDALRNGASRVVEFDLCLAARGSRREGEEAKQSVSVELI